MEKLEMISNEIKETIIENAGLSVFYLRKILVTLNKHELDSLYQYLNKNDFLEWGHKLDELQGFKHTNPRYEDCKIVFACIMYELLGKK